MVTPIFRTSTFCFSNPKEGKRSFEIAYHLDKPKKNEYPALIYTRVNNPNMEILEERLSILNNSEKSLVFSAGMAAITSTCFTFLKPGDSLIYSKPVYGGTDYLFNHILPSFGIKTVGVISFTYNDVEKFKNIENLKMFFIETPCNPLLKLTSIKKIKSIRNKINKDILIVVDNTMISPIYLQPLDLGADVVVYSITKFIGGHSDLVAGGVSSSKMLIEKIKVYRTILGTVVDPDTCWLIQRSLATLKLRIEQQCSTAKKIVAFLMSHDNITKIYYPGIEDQELFSDEYHDGGSMISFEILINIVSKF